MAISTLLRSFRSADRSSGVARRLNAVHHAAMATVAGTRAGRLVERDEHLASLREALARADEGRGSLVLVGGEAGAGKTTLVRRFSVDVDSAPLWGGCDPLPTPRPLGPIV